ncbi:hypothetical protein TPChic_0707a [Treponema pallidum subsp. pallidum str. Chicago]|nr:hypothetical protein TPChic_0707a [Treponema pallidum subsp. pallidum str. Chicago]
MSYARHTRIPRGEWCAVQRLHVYTGGSTIGPLLEGEYGSFEAV